jgi:hypothetical protein
MEERARFPEVAAKGGHYESFYIKACDPAGGKGATNLVRGSGAS